MTIESSTRNDCWNSLGVWSKSGANCERLKDVIHCRNCDVFVAAGRLIFERESPLSYQREVLSILASPEEEADQGGTKIIVFRLGSELFALPSVVLELITSTRPIHRLPHMKSPYIKGVVNISGEVCLCYSLMAVLDVSMSSSENTVNNKHIYERIVVVSIDEGRYVFPVDEIIGMAQLQEGSLKSPPSTISDEIKQLVAGAIQMDGNEIAVLDINNLHRLLSRA